jgi:hypothetical protein
MNISGIDCKKKTWKVFILSKAINTEKSVTNNTLKKHD